MHPFTSEEKKTYKQFFKEYESQFYIKFNYIKFTPTIVTATVVSNSGTEYIYTHDIAEGKMSLTNSQTNEVFSHKDPIQEVLPYFKFQFMLSSLLFKTVESFGYINCI